MSKLINISKQYKSQANKLLDKTGLVKDLEKFGKVYFTGSYAYDLMVNGDIDIEVVRAKEYSRKEIAEIFKKLYLQDKFRSYFIKGNWNDDRLGKTFPNGQYIGLKEKISGETWKVDIWFMDEKEYQQRGRKTLIVKQGMTDHQIELILGLKKFRNENNISITGYNIYKLVLKGKIGSLKEFKDYLKRERIVFEK